MARKVRCEVCTDKLRTYTRMLGKLRQVASEIYTLSLSRSGCENAVEALHVRLRQEQQAVHGARLALVRHAEEHARRSIGFSRE
jgi:hypothetical protein